MDKFCIITKDVYLKNVKSISFIIMILVPFVLMGAIYLAGNFAQQNSETDKIVVIAEDQQITDYLSQSDMGDFHFEAFSSEDEAKSKLSDEKIDAYMVVTTDNGEASGELFSENSLGQATQLLIQQQLTGLQSMMRASSLGISPEEVAALSQPAAFSRQKVSFDASLVIITFVLMFMSANIYKSNVLVYSEGGIWTSLKQSISIMRNERKKK